MLMDKANHIADVVRSEKNAPQKPCNDLTHLVT